MQTILSMFNIQEKKMTTVSVDDTKATSDVIVALPKKAGTLITTDEITSLTEDAIKSVNSNIFYIAKPSIVLPIDGTLNFYGYVKASAFTTNNNFIGKHTGSDWMFSTSPDFLEPELYENLPGSLTAYFFVPKIINTKHYAKVRFRSGDIISDWSDPMSFVTAIGYPENPTISDVMDSYFGTLTPNLSFSAMNIVNDTDVLKSVDIEIAADSGFINLVYSKYLNTIYLTGLQLIDVLSLGTTYYVRVKYHGDKYETGWSPTHVFVVNSKTTAPILVGNTTGFEDNTETITIDNYSASNSYVINVNGGSVARTGNKIYWKLPKVERDYDYSLTLQTKDLIGGLTTSDVIKYVMTVKNLNVLSDQTFLFTKDNLQSIFTTGTYRFDNGIRSGRYLNILDTTKENTEIRLYLKISDEFGVKYLPKAGDILYTSTGVELTVKAVVNPGAVNVYIEPVTPLALVPAALYSLDTVVTSTVITQPVDGTSFRSVIGSVLKETSANVIDVSKTQESLKVYVDNRYVDLKLNQQFVTENGDIVTVGGIRDDGTTSSISGIKTLVASLDALFAIKDNGELWGIGLNQSGQLGLGHNNVVDEWTYLGFKVLMVAGSLNTYAIREDNMVMVTGYNTYAALGLGHVDVVNTWTETGFYAKNIACGHNHAIAVATNGLLYGTGANHFGQLGYPNTVAQKNMWTMLSNAADVYTAVEDITCTGFSSFVKRTDGYLFSTGYNVDGVLGLGHNANVYGFTNTNFIINKLFKYSDSGVYTSAMYVTDSTNKVFGTGNNIYGQLGNDSTVNINTFTDLEIYAVDIVSNGCSTAIKTVDGEWFLSGRNDLGQLGVNVGVNIKKWTKALIDIKTIVLGTKCSMYVDNEDNIYGTGSNECHCLSKLELVSTLRWLSLPKVKPFLGTYKSNYWFIPKTELKILPGGLYPISDVFYNDVKASVKEAIVSNGYITAYHADVEFDSNSNLITSMDIPYTNKVYELFGNIMKLS